MIWKKIGSWSNTHVPNSNDIRKYKELYIDIYWVNGWYNVSLFVFTTIAHQSRMTLFSFDQSAVVIYNPWDSAALIRIDSFHDKNYNTIETPDYTIDVYGR